MFWGGPSTNCPLVALFSSTTPYWIEGCVLSPFLLLETISCIRIWSPNLLFAEWIQKPIFACLYVHLCMDSDDLYCPFIIWLVHGFRGCSSPVVFFVNLLVIQEVYFSFPLFKMLHTVNNFWYNVSLSKYTRRVSEAATWCLKNWRDSERSAVCDL